MQESYEIVRILHNLVRWAVLILGVIAAVRALAGWFGRRGWLPVDDRLGLFFTMSLDIQVLLGLLLYFVPSLITTANFSRLGDAMGNPSVRFFLVEHALLMLVAVVLAHIGRSRAKKGAEPNRPPSRRRYLLHAGDHSRDCRYTLGPAQPLPLGASPG